MGRYVGRVLLDPPGAYVERVLLDPPGAYVGRVLLDPPRRAGPDAPLRRCGSEPGQTHLRGHVGGTWGPSVAAPIDTQSERERPPGRGKHTTLIDSRRREPVRQTFEVLHRFANETLRVFKRVRVRIHELDVNPIPQNVTICGAKDANPLRTLPAVGCWA